MLTLLWIGIIFFSIIYTLGTYFEKLRLRKCKKIEYVYRGRAQTFIESQEEPTSVYTLFKDLFWKVGPFFKTTINKAQLEVGSIQPNSWGDMPKSPIPGNEPQSDQYKQNFFG